MKIRALIASAVTTMLMLLGIVGVSAQEWKRYQEIQDATGNQFAVYLRAHEKNTASESVANPFCGGSLVHIQVVVTAAHCIWGIYGDPNNPLSYNGGQLWIQEPGKHKSDSSAKRVKALKFFHPSSLERTINWPNLSQDDIAFIVLEEPLVEKVTYKFATTEQLEFAVKNKLSAYMFGYGFNSVAEHNAYYSIPQDKRYSIDNIMNPHKIEYKVIDYRLPSNYSHHIGLPKMILLKAGENCPATVSSGSPAVIVIDGEELLVGPGSHSTGWGCSEMPNYDVESKIHGFQYRNITSHISVAYFKDLMNEAIEYAELYSRNKFAEAKAKQEAEAKAKQEAEAKAKQEAEAKASAAPVKKTIFCVKGKIVKKVIGIKPDCPKNFRKK